MKLCRRIRIRWSCVEEYRDSMGLCRRRKGFDETVSRNKEFDGTVSRNIGIR
jgi:hypothetical protein